MLAYTYAGVPILRHCIVCAALSTKPWCPGPAFDRRIHIVIVSTPHGRVCATAVMTPVIT